MLVHDLIAALESYAPLNYAEPWDRVGLHLGSRTAPVSGPVMLTIDLTGAVLDEAMDLGCGAIVAYHPPIWEPLKVITDDTAKGAMLLQAARAGIAIYAPHTALDAVPGGISDWLCEGLSAGAEGVIHGDCRALTPHNRRDPDQEVKLITFVPADKVPHLRNALATAGAGQIGEYRVCAFATEGRGSFLAPEAGHPSVGDAGTLNVVDEVRLEMVCSKRALPLALETLEQFHPYEVPAIDVVELAHQPARRVGVGRKLTLDQPATFEQLAERLKAHLGRARVRLATERPMDEPVRDLGVVPGAGESLWPDARDAGCELFITGEMRHHEVLSAVRAGISVLLAGHTNTERGYLPRLARMLESRLDGHPVHVSKVDADILRVL